ncbi:prepilin-type N-terminal cleavage/methylation domain-containing protein [Acidithiobacillus sp. AMEEHan]|uniref:prepilin-type N-terminal cleavage/methylation domain-containing protein n=1 Tax=Acidithiobacillus sp. AMEEHan TaxID=2994951 RepID=UPI0027E3D7F0|nr:prepilin-type N-terminal cleavage/methylation domain-containing protein [Acidithiobacillus sp. AMEEHan]
MASSVSSGFLFYLDPRPVWRGDCVSLANWMVLWSRRRRISGWTLFGSVKDSNSIRCVNTASEVVQASRTFHISFFSRWSLRNRWAEKLKSDFVQNGFTLIDLTIVIAIIAILAALAISAYFQYLQTAKAQAVATDFKIAVDEVSNAYAASLNGVQTTLYKTLNGQATDDVADPVYGQGTPAFVTGGPGTICGQVVISSAVITASSPAETNVSVVTKDCSGDLGTYIARACSAAGFPSAATGSGVVINQNGGITP